jgi:hypothetical protein
MSRLRQAMTAFEAQASHVGQIGKREFAPCADEVDQIDVGPETRCKAFAIGEAEEVGGLAGLHFHQLRQWQTGTTAAVAPPMGQHERGDAGIEFGARMVHPLVSARFAALLHPIGAVIIGLMVPGAITAFAMLHGAGNGLLTIAKGTVPLAIFGPVGYGLRSGILGAPARATQAASPLLFALLMDRMGIGVLVISAGLSLSAFFALLILRARPTAAPAPA